MEDQKEKAMEHECLGFRAQECLRLRDISPVLETSGNHRNYNVIELRVARFIVTMTAPDKKPSTNSPIGLLDSNFPALSILLFSILEPLNPKP